MQQHSGRENRTRNSNQKFKKKYKYIRIEIEASKSNMMVFSNKSERENKIRLRIKGERIGNVRSAKFLGITFDSKLDFSRQLMQVQNKTDKALNIMRLKRIRH